MATDQRIFGLIGIGADVQFGKRNNRIKNAGDGFDLRDAADAAFVNLSVLDPTLPEHGATKNYVDAVASGLDLKASVRTKTDGTETNALSTWTSGTAASLSQDLTPATTRILTSPDNVTGNNTFGGVALVVGERVLISTVGGDDVTVDADNGVYEVTQVATGAAPTIIQRTADADSDSNGGGIDEFTSGLFVFVSEGTHAGQGWVMSTADPITIDTTGVVFTQFSNSGVQDPLFRQEVIDFNDSFPVNIGALLPADAQVTTVRYDITTFWDDNTEEHSVDSDGAQQYMSEDENDLGPNANAEGLYISENAPQTIDGTRQLQLTRVTAGTPSQGQGTVTVQYTSAG